MSKPPSLRQQLRVAQAKLKVYRTTVGTEVVQVRALGQPAKFVQAWPVQRGYSSVTQALDEDGQVWERISVVENVNGKKTLKASWWEPLDMTRKPREIHEEPTP